MRISLFVALTFLCGGCGGGETSEGSAHTSQELIYGEDDRVEVFAHPDSELRGHATSSVALFSRGALIEQGTAYELPESYTLGESEGLCESESFREQPTGSWCSGTLIGADLILTAGHCIETQEACDETTFVFDYLYEEQGRLAEIGEEDVYGCESLLVQELTRDADFAVIRLARPVTGHSPVPLHASAQLELGARLATIGSGSGLPLKIDSNGLLIEDEVDAWLVATDSFTGHSGAGVYDTARELVGVLVSGENDYVRDGDCFVVERKEPSQGAEKVQKLSVALGALCAVEAELKLCAGLVEEDPEQSSGKGEEGMGGAQNSSAPSQSQGAGGCSLASRSSRPANAFWWLLALAAFLRRRYLRERLGL